MPESKPTKFAPKPVDHVLAGRVAVRALNRKQPRSAQTFRRSELILARAYLDLIRQRLDALKEPSP